MKRFLSIVLALAVPPAIYFPTIGARRDQEIARLERQITELDMQVEQAHAAQRKLPQFHDEVTRLDTELVKLRTILPPSMQIDDVRSMVQRKAADAGVLLTKFKPGNPARRGELQEQSIDAEVTGDAAATSEFFLRLSNASRIVNVTHVTLRPNLPGWRTGFVISTFALPD